MNQSNLQEYRNKNITVVTGINGSGKSRWLIEQIQNNPHHCIVATTTIESKYSKISRLKNCNVMIPHSLYYNINSFITDYFQLNFEAFNNKRYVFSNYLEYIGFKPRIILEIINISDIYMMMGLSGDKERSAKKRAILDKLDYDNRFYIDLRENKLDEQIINVIELMELFGGKRHAGLQIKYLFERDSQLVSLNELSSGEINLFRIMSFFLFHIRDNSSLYIDEPENSLHPRWQYEFIGQLLDLTYMYNPQIYIATHSPFILAGLFEDKEHTQEKDHSIEKILYNYFDSIFPDSLVLPEILSDKITGFTKNIETKDEIVKAFTSLKNKTYTEKQKNIINFVSDNLNDYD
ncbi:AAA family ATPase [Leptospira saintgironsiae]|nr:AAA family ATPase [Leptospira saintgironsiae]